MKKFIQGTAAALIFLLLLSHPHLVYEGAKNGLLLWPQTVLPILLPFMICSNVIVALDTVHLLIWLFKPLLTHVLKLSPAGSYILVPGFLCGYPMGTKIYSEFLEDNRITGREASYLLSTYSHPSPVFLLGYMADRMTSDIPMAFFLVALYLPILPLSLLFRRYYDIHGTCQGMAREPSRALPFDRTMMSFVKAMVKVGGYIIPFSIPARLLQTLLKDYGASQAVFLSVIETTTGTQSPFFYMVGPAQALAIAAVTIFGGISGIFQTNSVLSESAKKAGLPTRYYILWKMPRSVVSCLTLVLLLAAFPQIPGQ